MEILLGAMMYLMLNKTSAKDLLVPTFEIELISEKMSDL